MLPVFKLNVDVVTVGFCTASLKSAETNEVTATPVAASAGVVLTTVGGVVSAAEAVVNDQVLSEAMALPAKSFTPVVKVAVYEVEAARDDVGSNVAVFPFNVTVPGILVVPAFRVKVVVLTVEL